MQRDTDVVTTKLLSDIKSLRDSFNKPTSEEQKSVTEMSNKISTGIYLVTQHLSDSSSIKMSLRKVANELINVVYSSKSEMYKISQEILSMSDRILSFINFARISGDVSEINSYLIEREVIKLERYITLTIARDDITQLQFSAKDRADTKMKLFELFDSETTDDIKRTFPKSSDKGHQLNTRTSTPKKQKMSSPKIQNIDRYGIEEEEVKGHEPTPQNILSTEQANIKDTVTEKNNATNSVPIREVEPAESPVLISNRQSFNDTQSTISQGQSSAPAGAPMPKQAGIQPKSTAGSAIQERKDNVLQIIKLNGIVSIKEIADNISDVSEKTLQRTLIDLVNEGLVIRHGDRRWSRYEAVL